MKLRNLILGALAIIGVAASCNKPENNDPASVEIKGELSYALEESLGEVDVTFVATQNWAIRGLDEADWLSADKESGNGSASEQTVKISVAPNTGSDREATLTIYCNPLAKKSFTISQKGPKGDGVEAISIADFIAKADGNTNYKLTGIVSGYANAEKYWGFDLQDKDDASVKVSCPFPANWDDFKTQIANGDEVTVVGPYQWYEAKSAHQVNKCTIVEVKKGEPVDPSKIQTITCAEFIAKADAATDYRLVGKVTSSVNTDYCSFDMSDDGGKSTVVVWTVNNASAWKDIVKKDGTVTVYGKYMKYESNGNVKHEMVDAYIEAFEEATPEPIKGDPQGDGTEANPYNATAAHLAAAALAADAPTSDFYYIKGFVKSIKEISTSYGNATFYMTDTAAGDTQEFYCYQIMYIGGEKFTSEDQLKVGDEVVVYAQLVNYKGNTPETNGKGSGKIISINGNSEVAPTPSYPKTLAHTSWKMEDGWGGFAIAIFPDASTGMIVNGDEEDGIWWDEIADPAEVLVTYTYDPSTGTGAMESLNLGTLPFEFNEAGQLVVVYEGEPFFVFDEIEYVEPQLPGFGGDEGGDEGGETVDPYATTVTYALGTSSYDDGLATVNGTEGVKTIKIGTSKAAGNFTITLPAGTSSVSFYAVGWKGSNTSVVAKVGDTTVAEQAVAANDGATGNAPYTLTVSDSDHYTLPVTVPAETTITVSASARVIFFGIQAK